MSQIPINCSASDIQEVFASGRTPVYELTEEKSLEELMAEFGWIQEQARRESPGPRHETDRFGDPAGAW